MRRHSCVQGYVTILTAFAVLMAASAALAGDKGIRPGHDQCPDDPEDMDGFEDDDGCPDPDNDQDGILDIDDKCPNVPEDRDGFEDDDGCPDPDNDQDRILDVNDACPLEPETWNNYRDDDGCPDTGPPRIVDQRIDVLESIYFVTNDAIIQAQSFPVLDSLAGVLNKASQVELVEIQGHADERDSASHNRRLTQERAEAVKRYLVEHGVAATRLVARGYGAIRPKCREHTDACWSQNRRVEFVILRRATE